uniref:Uncharacterized protein n=1 Tax=Ananas comosus var. bracteatus TaxID=296719 RepID=A0A6V7PBS0_ANACO|nr:unnamed protein product [Ananas comosus var. bracteatus]
MGGNHRFCHRCGTRFDAGQLRSNHYPQWLIHMMSKSEKKQNEKHTKMFDPVVVAISPYHCGEPHLLAMEDQKKAASRAFAKPNAHALYNKVVEIVGECRDCYDGGSLPLMSIDEFTCMLFIDGCFILQFIDQVVKNDMNDFTMRAHLQGFILRDMFLLENQLPYLLLEKLMEAKSVDIDKFVDQVADTQGQWQKMEKEKSSKSIDGVHQHPWRDCGCGSWGRGTRPHSWRGGATGSRSGRPRS